MTPRQQRAALMAIVRRIFPDARQECSSLEFMKVPENSSRVRILSNIYNTLRKYRNFENFITPNRRLLCDIVVHSECIIIEYDERQHFTMPRALALQEYPADFIPDFNVEEWIRHCHTIRATDNDPPYRDEQRAFYDSVRDIAAIENGYRVIRIKHGSLDWTAGNAEEALLAMVTRKAVKNAKRQTRLVTVCVEGSKAKQHRAIDSRTSLMKEIIGRIDERWSGLDAIVFPGGFFRSKRHVGNLSYEERVAALAESNLGDTIGELAATLCNSPGALIVAGIDGPGAPGEGGDQLCVAWNTAGIIGIGRKIFPVGKGESGAREADSLTCYADDYSTNHRVVALPSGRSAVLCACYDMFGVPEKDKRLGIQAKGIRRITDETRRYRRDANAITPDAPAVFRRELVKCVDGWSKLLDSKEVSVGLAAIHEFPAHSTVYWQKHGIASCSAALNGGLAVGAAHFISGLPSKASASPLAARRVPRHHLEKGVERPPHNWAAKDHFFDPKGALVRLYED